MRPIRRRAIHLLRLITFMACDRPPVTRARRCRRAAAGAYEMHVRLIVLDQLDLGIGALAKSAHRAVDSKQNHTRKSYFLTIRYSLTRSPRAKR